MEVQLKRYFEARGVPVAPDSAEASKRNWILGHAQQLPDFAQAYMKIRKNLLLAAEDPALSQFLFKGHQISWKTDLSRAGVGQSLAQR